jgi:transcriptional regulator with XRE-family HTH domain
MVGKSKQLSQNLNLEDAKVRFSKALNIALIHKFGRVPTANAFANQFNFRAEGMTGVTRETARKWLAGQAIPEVAKLIVLVDWLELDANAFMSTRPTEIRQEDDVVIDTIRELLKHMDIKTRSMILITAWALRETQGLQAHKLDLPTLRRALMLNLDHNN